MVFRRRKAQLMNTIWCSREKIAYRIHEHKKREGEKERGNNNITERRRKKKKKLKWEKNEMQQSFEWFGPIVTLYFIVTMNVIQNSP